MSVYFRKPPVNEVVIATSFDPVLELRSEHIGLFWARIRKYFPTVHQHPPVGIESFSNDIFPMPRYWFTSKDETIVIQIQKSAIMFNWRRTDSAYPRYRSIKPKFDDYYAMFEEFIRNEVFQDELTINLCELTYVNTIQQCQFWTGPKDTNKVLPYFHAFSTGVDRHQLSNVNCTFVFRTEDDLRLQVSVRNGTTVTSPNIPTLMFEIKATEQLGGCTKPDVDKWIDRAHVAVMDCFLGMTSHRIQTEYWGLETDS